MKQRKRPGQKKRIQTMEAKTKNPEINNETSKEKVTKNKEENTNKNKETKARIRKLIRTTRRIRRPK